MIWFCLMIFFVRIVDVSLGTIRMIFIVKGRKIISALIAFAEALIWFLIVKEALTVTNPSIYIAIAYALGFSVGTFVGSSLARKFILGKIMIQVYSNLEDNSLINAIRENGHGITVLSYKGIDESKDGKLLNISVDKSKQKSLIKLINKHDADAFIVINETKYVENGYFK